MSALLDRIWRWLRGGEVEPKGSAATEEPITREGATQLTATIIGSDSDGQMALLTVSGGLREAMISKYREQWAKSGTLSSNGGKIAPATIFSVVGAAGGSAGLSTALSSQLFIATANPATLMAIKGGVGSAVVSGGAIVGQAPFLAASSAIVPVAAPLVVLHAISTLIVLKQFALVRKDLARVERAIERVLHRTEATFSSELVAISTRLDSLEEQFADEKQFSMDMIVRLALAEERVTALCERYKLLNGSQIIAAEASEADLDFKVHDSRLAVIASSMSLRIGYLRLALSLQESPARTPRLLENFGALCDQHDSLLKQIKSDGARARALADDLEAAVDAMGWYQRTMPSVVFGARGLRSDATQASMKLRAHGKQQQEVEENEVSAAASLERQARDALGGISSLAIVYWKDEFGEHSYYVNDLPYEIVRNDGEAKP